MSALFHQPIEPKLEQLREPALLAARLSRLQGLKEGLEADIAAKESRLAEVEAYLARAPRVEAALQVLSRAMFLELVETLEVKLTMALEEVLEQPLTFKAKADVKRGTATVEFSIQRDGAEEDIMRGQGGSVANVLSVGLRMFALATLDPQKHRRFLVLDEPDGWLRPELVPRLVKIIRDAGKALGFQVVLISHHDSPALRDLADRVYSFEPQPDGSVRVSESGSGPKNVDTTDVPSTT